MKEPIIEFENQEQLNLCLKEWQNLLFLNHWIITVQLDDETEIDGQDCNGKIDLFISKNCAIISIRKPDKLTEKSPEKYCAEKTLVHELLHCKYNWMRALETFEGGYCDTKEHALIEQMAKTLIMVKYGVTFEWFKAVIK